MFLNDAECKILKDSQHYFDSLLKNISQFSCFKEMEFLLVLGFQKKRKEKKEN